MREEDVGVLPVVDNGSLAGIVTDRDIVVRALADGRNDANVDDVMSSNPVTLSPDDDERQAEQLMAQYESRRLAVTDGQRLVGMLSVGDLAVRADERLAGQVMEETGPHDH